MNIANLYNRFYIFLLRNKLHHVLFWAVYLFTVAYLISPGHDFFSGFFPALSILMFHALASYVNLYFFIPNMLYQRKYVAYVLSLFLTILLVCFPLAVVVNGFFPTNRFLATDIWTPIFFAVNSIYILLTVSVTSFIHLFSEWYRKDRRNKELENLNTLNELRFLKSQINPHFLFNCLNNLYALTTKKSEKAPEMVMSLSNILRYLLYETGSAKVPLQKEIDYMEDLLALEKIRVGDRATIRIQIEGDVDSIMIEPLLFINFIENSFKHGVNSMNEEAWIHIHVCADGEGQKVSFEIENSKPVENLHNKNDRPGGIGLQNTKKRLKLLYPNKHTLTITETETVYSVKLLLNLN